MVAVVSALAPLAFASVAAAFWRGSLSCGAVSVTFARFAKPTGKAKAPSLASSRLSLPHHLDALPLLPPSLRRPLVLASNSLTAASLPLWSPPAPVPDALFPVRFSFLRRPRLNGRLPYPLLLLRRVGPTREGA